MFVSEGVLLQGSHRRMLLRNCVPKSLPGAQNSTRARNLKWSNYLQNFRQIEMHFTMFLGNSRCVFSYVEVLPGLLSNDAWRNCVLVSLPEAQNSTRARNSKWVDYLQNFRKIEMHLTGCLGNSGCVFNKCAVLPERSTKGCLAELCTDMPAWSARLHKRKEFKVGPSSSNF